MKNHEKLVFLIIWVGLVEVACAPTIDALQAVKVLSGN